MYLDCYNIVEPLIYLAMKSLHQSKGPSESDVQFDHSLVSDARISVLSPPKEVAGPYGNGLRLA